LPKNIVICCDGTGNQINDQISNVLKLYRVLHKTSDQLVYYNPGVGTVGDYDSWQIAKQKVREFLGLATGYGLDDNVLDAYRFLCTHHEDGDEIWLFGFSRGAYTVRVLAAFVYVIGLLRPSQLNLADYAFTAYKKASHDSRKDGKLPEADALKIAAKKSSVGEVASGLPAAWEFARVASTKRATIKFVGVWDTVASVIVPRPDRLLLDLQSLRFTRTNPGVEIFRQAISIDERRRMFRLHRWTEPQTFKSNPFNNKHWKPQDIRQVRFAGVHADIGGGYPEKGSGLSKYPLRWMIDQAHAAGLKMNTAMFNHLVLGHSRKDSQREYDPPSPDAEPHRSLKGFWWVLEFIPKLTKFRDWPLRPTFLGLYLPLAEPRPIAKNALVDPSVEEHQQAHPEYQPVNLAERVP